eukprot:GHVU01198535.1.p1 GENE.GHVU01198535.1~~GHVU01198535.1.p1  ORF type:complete len:129 (+),score=12.80 GHVU01198535.1:2205-2591(+)
MTREQKGENHRMEMAITKGCQICGYGAHPAWRYVQAKTLVGRTRARADAGGGPQLSTRGNNSGWWKRTRNDNGQRSTIEKRSLPEGLGYFRIELWLKRRIDSEVFGCVSLSEAAELPSDVPSKLRDPV